MLRSAVGIAHVLRSVLVMGYATYYILPTGQHGLCFGCCFSGPLPLRSLINGPPIGVRFRESLIIRLHSEIDHIQLSIEDQCVTTLLTLGDCHNWDDIHFSVSLKGYIYSYSQGENDMYSYSGP